MSGAERGGRTVILSSWVCDGAGSKFTGTFLVDLFHNCEAFFFFINKNSIFHPAGLQDMIITRRNNI